VQSTHGDLRETGGGPVKEGQHEPFFMYGMII